MQQEDNKNFGSSWGEEQKPDLGRSFGEKSSAPVAKISFISHRIFWALVILVACGTAISGFYLYNYFSASREISLDVSCPNNVLMGAPFDLAVNFDNSSKNILRNAKLSIFLPEGTTAVGANKEKRVFEKEMGDINPDGGFNEKIKVLVFSGGESVKKFEISASYDLSLGAVFEKKQSVEFSVREPAIKIDLVAPEKVLNNEEFETIIKYSNISEFDFSGVNLNFNLPNNFIVKSFNQATVGDVLKIGDLRKNQNGELVIVGKISGATQSFFEINSGIEASYGGQIFKISEKTAKVNIAPSPLFLKIESDAAVGYVFSGDDIKFQLIYSNNSDVGLADIVIKAKLSGEMFDFSKLKTNASYNSRDNTLIWNAASNSGLRLIESGGSGAVEFEIGVKEAYAIKKLSDKNFLLKVAAEISSPTVPYYVAADKTTGFANREVRAAGAITVDSKIYFRDYSSLASEISNKGSLPPVVDKPVNFVVHWIIKNYATDIKEVRVGAFLGSGVRFSGGAKSNINTVPVYNERTQEVSWFIDKIAATKGVINKPVEAVFQIELLPNINQVGESPLLIGDSSISAIDEFVNVKLANTAKFVTTRELSDTGFDSRNGEVIK
jgi:hypothetical protein